jgi:hypothetical protein
MKKKKNIKQMRNRERMENEITFHIPSNPKNAVLDVFMIVLDYTACSQLVGQ